MIKKKNTFKVQHHIYLTHLGYILKHTKLLLHLSFIFPFMVEFDQHFSMTVRIAPTSEHLVLQIIKLTHQRFVASYKLFKQIIGCISWKVSLVRIHPHAFFSTKVLYIFVKTWSDIHMIILLQPFLERFVSLIFSMITIDTFQYWRRHIVNLDLC